MDIDGKSSEESLLNWSAQQGHILTGNGILSNLSVEGIDFDEKDLPHYLLKNKCTVATMNQWLNANKKSYAIVGSWSRPLFSGGWMESGSNDTDAYNLQSPSLFIDMRFPTARPVSQLKKAGSLASCSLNQLRILARQHCFSGYSYPEEKSNSSNLRNQPPMFTRHHFVDWNYHSMYPRNRPNRWWVEVSPNDDSFKEYSFIRDSNNVPVYFERWARRQGDSNGQKYLALRRVTECPKLAAVAGRQVQRAAICIVVGNHFAIAVDRPNMDDCFGGYAGPGGAAGLVDYAVASARDMPQQSRACAENILELCGCFGHIKPACEDGSNLDGSKCPNMENKSNWLVHKSTHPWKEGQPLIKETVHLVWDHTLNSHDGRPTLLQVHWGEYVWQVVECSFSRQEVEELFRPYLNRSRL